MSLEKRFRGESAIYQYISDINAALFNVDEETMLGPKELKHYLYWIVGYNSGIRSYKGIIQFIQERMFEGRKNNVIYTVKRNLLKGHWIKVELGLVDIPEQFKFNGDIEYSKTIDLHETANKQEEVNN